jgi:hypothetical protein
MQNSSIPSKAALGFISGLSVNVWFMTSVIDLFGSDVNRRFDNDLIAAFGPHIDQNRNWLAETFLTSPELQDKEWLFMVDNDMVFRPEDVWELFWEGDQRGPGIYAAPYMQENQVLACGPWDNNEKLGFFRNLLQLPPNPTQVGVVGMGFTLIHREVLESAGPKPFTMQPDFESEDVAFCWKTQADGNSYHPWIVPSSRPGHFKTFTLYAEGMKNAIGDDVNLVEV